MPGKSSEMVRLMEGFDIDALLLCEPSSLKHFANFFTLVYSRFAALIVFKSGESVLVVPKLEESLADATARCSELKSYVEYPSGQTENPFRLIKQCFESRGLFNPNIGIEGEFIGFRAYCELRKALKGSKLVDVSAAVEKLKMVKSKEELGRIRTAVKLSTVGMEAAIKATRKGKTEVQVQCIGESAIFREVGERYPRSVVTIAHANVISGVETAFPHRVACGKRIKSNELVYHVWVTSFEWYFDELARTVFTGKPSQKHLEIFDIVMEAHEKTLAAVEPGIKASELDQIARRVVGEAGYGEYFIFPTGHGLGLRSGEGPRLKVGDETILKPGMVISIEPGVYIPGFGGIGGNSDTVFVTNEGHELVTKYPRTLSPEDLET